MTLLALVAHAILAASEVCPPIRSRKIIRHPPPNASAPLRRTRVICTQSQRHYHGGRLTRYEIGPPAVQLSASDESRLRSGRAVLQSVESEDGLSRRLIMVQDIQAPSHIVLGWVANPSSRDAAGR